MREQKEWRLLHCPNSCTKLFKQFNLMQHLSLFLRRDSYRPFLYWKKDGTDNSSLCKHKALSAKSCISFLEIHVSIFLSTKAKKQMKGEQEGKRELRDTINFEITQHRRNLLKRHTAKKRNYDFQHCLCPGLEVSQKNYNWATIVQIPLGCSTYFSLSQHLPCKSPTQNWPMPSLITYSNMPNLQ